MVVGGGLAGLAATMKLAELGIDVDLISLTPVKRSHSVCAQGGINSCNDQTRQLGDSEWKHAIDGLRYALHPWIFAKERRGPVPELRFG